MEEEKEEYPEELFEGYEESYIQKLKEKLELIKSEKLCSIAEYKKYYLAGVRYLYSLVSKLKDDEVVKFWDSFNISDLVSQLNNVNNLTKVVSKTIFNLDSDGIDVEMVNLIVRDYYKRIINKIKKNE